jgi:hypothetical protein
MRERRQTDRIGRLVDGRRGQNGADARVAALAANTPWQGRLLAAVKACARQQC